MSFRSGTRGSEAFPVGPVTLMTIVMGHFVHRAEPCGGHRTHGVTRGPTRPHPSITGAHDDPSYRPGDDRRRMPRIAAGAPALAGSIGTGVHRHLAVRTGTRVRLPRRRSSDRLGRPGELHPTRPGQPGEHDHPLLHAGPDPRLLRARTPDAVHDGRRRPDHRPVALYGSPTAANDVSFFAKTFHGPTPDFEAVFPLARSTTPTPRATAAAPQGPRPLTAGPARPTSTCSGPTPSPRRRTSCSSAPPWPRRRACRACPTS